MGNATSKVLELDGSGFVIGMVWRHEENKPGRRRLRELAEREGRWGMVRRTAEGKFQAGFCETLDGETPDRLRSLADTIADTNVAPWRGILDLGDGMYWYIAVADGYEMLPDGDCVVSGTHLAELRNTHDGYFVWRDVEFSEGDLEELVAANGAGRRPLRNLAPSLRDSLRFSRRTWAFVGSVFVVGVVGGAAVVLKQRADERAAAEAAAVRRAAEIAAQENEAKPAPPVWVTLPAADSVFEACKVAWANQALARPGWVLASWTCAGGGSGLDVGEEWVIDGGRARDVPGIVKDGGQSASASRSAPVQWPAVDASEVLELLPSHSADKRAWDLAQRFDIALSMAAISSKAKPETLLSSVVEAEAVFVLPFAPWFGFGPEFDEIPGFRVTRIKLDMHTESWSVAGRLFSVTQPDK